MLIGIRHESSARLLRLARATPWLRGCSGLGGVWPQARAVRRRPTGRPSGAARPGRRPERSCHSPARPRRAVEPCHVRFDRSLLRSARFLESCTPASSTFSTLALVRACWAGSNDPYAAAPGRGPRARFRRPRQGSSCCARERGRPGFRWSSAANRPTIRTGRRSSPGSVPERCRWKSFRNAQGRT